MNWWRWAIWVTVTICAASLVLPLGYWPFMTLLILWPLRVTLVLEPRLQIPDDARELFGG